MGKFLLVPRNGIITLVVVVALILPIAINFASLDTSITFDLMLPSSADSLITFQEMEEKFGAGTLSPYKVLFDGRANDVDISTLESFQAYDLVINHLLKFEGSTDESKFNGISTTLSTAVHSVDDPPPFIPDEITPEVSQGFYEFSLNTCVEEPSTLFCDSELVASVQLIADQLNNDDGTATVISIILSVDPFATEGTDWLSDARDAISNLSDANMLNGFDVVLVGGAGVEVDAVQQVYDVFPVMIISTSA